LSFKVQAEVQSGARAPSVRLFCVIKYDGSASSHLVAAGGDGETASGHVVAAVGDSAVDKPRTLEVKLECLRFKHELVDDGEEDVLGLGFWDILVVLFVRGVGGCGAAVSSYFAAMGPLPATCSRCGPVGTMHKAKKKNTHGAELAKGPLWNSRRHTFGANHGPLPPTNAVRSGSPNRSNVEVGWAHPSV
jgi:hypothetical protein